MVYSEAVAETNPFGIDPTEIRSESVAVQPVLEVAET